MYIKENWIDFESEIGKLIKVLDNTVYELSNNFNDVLNMEISRFDLPYKKIEFIKKNLFYVNIDKLNFSKIRDKLYTDLNRLIRLIEIYLVDFVEEMDIKCISNDIKEIAKKIIDCPNGGRIVEVNNVICFNYSNTYEKMYVGCNALKEHIDFIHGKAKSTGSIESNNMVLGIDEYLSDDKKNKNVEFIEFKKYYQRILKQTGCKFKDWIDIIKNEWEKESDEYKRNMKENIRRGNMNAKGIHRLYIYGHSLDVTDKDIIRDLILNDNVYSTIFYHNKKEFGRKIANLVKIIGQDELIRRTGGSTKTIEFKQQQDMIPINTND